MVNLLPHKAYERKIIKIVNCTQAWIARFRFKAHITWGYLRWFVNHLYSVPLERVKKNCSSGNFWSIAIYQGFACIVWTCYKDAICTIMFPFWGWNLRWFISFSSLRYQHKGGMLLSCPASGTPLMMGQQRGEAGDMQRQQRGEAGE